jgi:MFS family permease
MSHAVRLPCDEAAIRCEPGPVPGTRTAGTWVLAATIIGSSLAFIDGTVVTVALPAIAREFDATGAEVQWVVEAYALFLAALLLEGGALGDRYGRRRVYALGIILFTIASVVCAFAPSIRWLILARAVQGMERRSGALALISASFEPARRGRAIGTWSGFSGITAAIGPLVGGWLVNHSWRWAFLLNVPLAAVVLLLLPRIPESRNPRARRLDYRGAGLVTLGLAGLVFGLIESSARGWGSPAVLGAIVLGCAALVAFVLVEARTDSPMLPLGLFQSADFTGANLLTLFLYGALSSVFFFLPLNLIQVQGYSPLQAGAALLPFIAILFVFSRWSGGLVERYGARRPPRRTGHRGARVRAHEPARNRGTLLDELFSANPGPGRGNGREHRTLTTAVMNAVGGENAGIAFGDQQCCLARGGSFVDRPPRDSSGERLRAGSGAKRRRPAARSRSTPSGARRAQLLSRAPSPQAACPEGDAARVRTAIETAFVAGFRVVSLASAAWPRRGSMHLGLDREGRASVYLERRGTGRIVPDRG